MGKGSEDSNNQITSQLFQWNEIKSHNTKNDLWIVIDGYVYDITKFQKKHPGGHKVINFYSGQDASEAFIAFHKDQDRTRKYMNMYRIGKLDEFSNDESLMKINQNRQKDMKVDFENLRKLAVHMNLFKPNYLFYFLHGFHIIFFHLLGFYILNKFGAGILPILSAFICHTIAKAQAGWNQHDYGHLSVFKNRAMNRYFHLLFIGFVKGASGAWWNHVHNQHHAKPNVIDKDPDIRIDPFFVLGDVQPIQTAKKNAKNKNFVLPYNYQEKYFLLVAPLLLPLFFYVITVRHAFKNRLYLDLTVIAIMYAVFLSMIIPPLGFIGSLAYLALVRCADSTWFTWVTQLNHISMDVHEEKEEDTWLSLQLKATCNIEKSFFNDWFTGHLNFQIEHHLFPTMPRHNYYKIQPMVQSLCKKHGVNYEIKPLGKAFMDILFSLKKSGKLWREAYDEILNTN